MNKEQQELLNEALHRGKNVKLGSPFRTPGGPKKFAVYVKTPGGGVKKVTFGDPNLRVKNANKATTKKLKVMNNLDRQYTDLLQDILDNGTRKMDRTGTGTISVFGRQIRHKMSEGFPAITTKKMAFKTMVTELLWFLRGSSDIRFLWENNCTIWDGDWEKNYKTTCSEPYTIEEVKQKVKDGNHYFNDSMFDMGKIYGHQWRKWNGKSDDELYEDYLKKVKK